jgi:lipopolysaccharide biosynthesis glycosyltransferase
VGDPIDVVVAADAAYAVPLEVTVRSAVEHATVPVRLHVLDGGLPPAVFDRLGPTVADLRRYDVAAAVAGLPTFDHVSPASYARLGVGDLLPSDVDRVLYLDVDVLVRHDLAPLASTPLGDRTFAAVVDERVRAFDERWSPGHVDDGIPTGAPYCNSGALVIDLHQWREERIGERALALVDARGAASGYDQGALNTVAWDRWTPVEPHWNQQSSIYHRRSWAESPYDRRAFRRAVLDPSVVHFTMTPKPWDARCRHPFATAWRRAAGVGTGRPDAMARLRRSRPGLAARAAVAAVRGRR